jgi:hypothetical protein
MPDEIPSGTIGWIFAGLSIGWSNLSMFFKSKVNRVGTKFIFGSDLMANEVSRAIYEGFLPAALAESKHIAAPEPQVVGKGLEYIQEALDVQKRGVSAKKVVVSL